MKRFFIILLAGSFFAVFSNHSPVAAESAKSEPATHHYTLKRAQHAINVDGRLDEAVWKAAEALRLSAKNGGEPRQATTVRILWDQYYLYFAFDCVDSHIWATMEKRDEPLYNEEVVEVFIDADSDGATYLELEVNPLGTLWDGYILNTEERRVGILAWNSLDIRWAVHLEGTVNEPSDEDKGWSAELALPLTDIYTAPNMPPKAGDSWRLNLYRIDLPDGAGKRGEGTAWSPVSGRTFHDPDRFGEVIFSDEVVK